MKNRSLFNFGRVTAVCLAVLTASSFSPGAEVERISNGGFESGAVSWSRNGDSGIFEGSYPRPGGTWYGYLGNANNAIGSIHQFIDIPATAASGRLTFYLNLVTFETDLKPDDDQMDVNFRDAVTDVLLKKWITYTEADKGDNVAGRYVQKTITFTSADLQPFKGKRVLLQFYAKTDYADSTIFRLDDVSFIFVTEDTPSPPTQLGTEAFDNRIALKWSDNSDNETGFKIERKAENGSWTQINTVSANINSYTDYDVSECNGYIYRVRAYNGLGDSGYSDEIPNFVRKVPAAPTSLVASPTATGIDLKWQDNACNEHGYRVERKTGATGTWAQLGNSLAADIVGVTDASAGTGVLYYYRVYAFNDTGSSSFSGEVSGRLGNQYTVTASAGPNGSVNPNGSTVVAEGSTLKLVASPVENYTVDAWFVDETLAQAGGTEFISPPINANHAINVTFKLRTFKLEIGGSLDLTEVFIDEAKAQTLASYTIPYGTRVTVRKNLLTLTDFVEYWSLENVNGFQKIFGNAVTTPMLSDTLLKAVIGQRNANPEITASITPSGQPVISVPPSGTTSSEIETFVEYSHDLVCWHDFDINPSSSPTQADSGLCSFGTLDQQTRFVKSPFRVKVRAQPTLMFPLPSRKATTARVTSLLDHCNADKFKLFSYGVRPNSSWYGDGVIGSYTPDEMFMTYKGERFCSGNATIKSDDGRVVFSVSELQRPLEFNYDDGDGDPTKVTLGYSGHPGYDYGAGGLPNGVVVAAEGGTIVASLCGEFENRIFIEHERLGIATAYLHLKQWSTEIFDHKDTSDESHLFYYAKSVPIKKGDPIGVIGGAGRQEIGRLIPREILTDSIASRLNDGSTLSAYLLSRFSESARSAVAGYPNNGITWPALQSFLSAEFNEIIRGPSIYESTRFAQVALSPHTQNLRIRTPNGANLELLNRLLLEDGFLGCFAVEHRIQVNLQRFGDHLHFELYRVVVQDDGKKYFILMDPYGAFTVTGKQAYSTFWSPDETPPMEYDPFKYKP